LRGIASDPESGDFMLSLAEQQQGLRSILRGQPVDTEADPWLASVAESRGLDVLRDIAAWWQRFQIEWQCRYTSRLLKRMGCFEECVSAHFAEHPAPPAIEEMSGQFLLSLSRHHDALLRAVAGFELACIARAGGRKDTVTVEWDRNPNTVMDALNRGGGLPEAEEGVRYVLKIGPELPGGVACVRKTAWKWEPRRLRSTGASAGRRGEARDEARVPIAG
jgi:hypothetical protein